MDCVTPEAIVAATAGTAATAGMELILGAVPLLRKIRNFGNELSSKHPEKPRKGFWNG